MKAESSSEKTPDQPDKTNTVEGASSPNQPGESTASTASGPSNDTPTGSAAKQPAVQSDGAPSPKPAAPAKGAAQKRSAPTAAEFDESGPGTARAILRQTPGLMVSAVLHAVVLVILAWWTLPADFTDELRQLVIAPTDSEMEELEELDEELVEDIELDTSMEVADVETIVEPEPEASPFDEEEAAAVKVELSDFGLEKAPKNDLLATTGAYSGNALSGRGEGQRQAMVARNGGDRSERTGRRHGPSVVGQRSMSRRRLVVRPPSGARRQRQPQSGQP